MLEIHSTRYPGVKKAPIGTASNGYLGILQWLLTSVRDDRRYPEEENEKQAYKPAMTEAMSVAAGNGDVESIQWLHLRRDSREHPWYGITPAAENGCLDLVKWMVKNAHLDMNVSGIANTVTTKGNLEILVLLHEYANCRWYGLAMDAAAANNQLHVVKWLHANRTKSCGTAAMDVP